jgi:hypothetical protein
MKPVKEMTPKELVIETTEVSAEIGDLLRRREELIEEQFDRNLVKGLRGLQPLANRVADILHLTPPQITVGQRTRDETGFWTTAQNVAYLVEAFIKQGAPEE